MRQWSWSNRVDKVWMNRRQRRLLYGLGWEFFDSMRWGNIPDVARGWGKRSTNCETLSLYLWTTQSLVHNKVSDAKSNSYEASALSDGSGTWSSSWSVLFVRVVDRSYGSDSDLPLQWTRRRPWSLATLFAPHRDWHCHGIILIPSKCIIYFCPDSKLELDFCVTQVQAAAEGLDFASSQGLARGIDSALSHLQ